MDNSAAYVVTAMLGFAAMLIGVALYDWIARRREAKKH